MEKREPKAIVGSYVQIQLNKKIGEIIKILQNGSRKLYKIKFTSDNISINLYYYRNDFIVKTESEFRDIFNEQKQIRINNKIKELEEKFKNRKNKEPNYEDEENVSFEDDYEEDDYEDDYEDDES